MPIGGANAVDWLLNPDNTFKLVVVPDDQVPNNRKWIVVNPTTSYVPKPGRAPGVVSTAPPPSTITIIGVTRAVFNQIMTARSRR